MSKEMLKELKEEWDSFDEEPVGIYSLKYWKVLCINAAYRGLTGSINYMTRDIYKHLDLVYFKNAERLCEVYKLALMYLKSKELKGFTHACGTKMVVVRDGNLVCCRCGGQSRTRNIEVWFDESVCVYKWSPDGI